MTATAIVHQETPGFFEAAGETLFCVHTRPSGQANGIGVVLLPQQSILHSSSLSVRLARQLADDGFDVLRFDLHGVGESTGTSVVQLDNPYVDDVLAAVEWLRGRGLDRFVLVGGCFGARSVLAAAPAVDGLQGVLLAAMPVGDAPSLQAERVGRLLKGGLKGSTLRSLTTSDGRRTFARLLRTEARWVAKRVRRGHKILARLIGGRKRRKAGGGVSPKVQRPLERLASNGVPVLFLFGREDAYYQLFQQSLAAGLDQVVDLDSEAFELDDSLDGELHGFKTLAAQEHFVRATRGWLARGLGSA